jgi:hypothetical protein
MGHTHGASQHSEHPWPYTPLPGWLGSLRTHTLHAMQHTPLCCSTYMHIHLLGVLSSPGHVCSSGVAGYTCWISLQDEHGQHRTLLLACMIAVCSLICRFPQLATCLTKPLATSDCGAHRRHWWTNCYVRHWWTIWRIYCATKASSELVVVAVVLNMTRFCLLDAARWSEHQKSQQQCLHVGPMGPTAAEA